MSDCIAPRLKVGVDVSSLAMFRSGIARYTIGMLSSLLDVASDFDFILYSPRPVDIPLASGRWTAYFGGGVVARSAYLWLQTVCPALLSEHGVNVFWGQNYALPLKVPSTCRRILTVHDLSPVVCPETVALRNRLWTTIGMVRSFAAADAIVADSEATARGLRRRMKVSARRLTVAYCGLDSQMTPIEQAEAREYVVARFGLSGDFLLNVATIEPRKNHLALLAAVEQLPSAPLLVLAGAPGWNCAAILGRIEDLQSRGRVKYLGRVSDQDLAALYGAATLMVYPSLYEGFGLPVLEAMACGCPVLCSWTSSLPEVGGDAVAYFRPKDREELATSISRLVADRGALERMRHAGRQRARCFSYDTAARSVAAVMRRMAPT